MKFKYHIVLLFALCFCLEMKSQTIAVKSKLLYDLTSSINAGIELGLSLIHIYRRDRIEL